MDLNIENVKKICSNGGFNKELIADIVNDKFSVSNLYYKDNVGFPSGSPHEVIALIDSSAYDFSNELSYFDLSQSYKIINFITFLPSQLEKNFDKLVPFVLPLNYSASCKVLSVPRVFEIFSENIFRIEKLENASDGFLFSFLFCSVSNNYISNDLAEFFIDSRRDGFSKDVLKKIKRNLNNKIQNVGKSEERVSGIKRKIALLVSGQVRNDLSGCNGLSGMMSEFEVDLFFSSWCNKGVSEITRGKMPRYFDKDAKKIVLEKVGGWGRLDLNYFNKLLKKRFSYLSYDEVSSVYSDCKKKYINIKDDNLDPFSSMSNPEKMYYHNSYWVNQLGEKFFEEYDLIVKVRPDVEISNINIESICGVVDEKSFMTDFNESWVYRIWGLGVGDQVLIGRPSVMTRLLNFYSFNEIDETSEIMKNVLYQDAYLGHVNLAIKALLEGFEPKGKSFFEVRYSDSYKFGESDIECYMKR